MTSILTFGFVHGGYHGAWCWQRVIGALDVLGHRGIAMDLPCSDENAGTADYAAEVVSSVTDVRGPVVLVGHSLGGLTIPLVATQRPVERMIFIASLLPVPGLSFYDQLARTPDILHPQRGDGWAARWYNTCTPADASWAMSLTRPQAMRPLREVTPLAGWPDLPTHFLIGTEDRSCNLDWARRSVPERLGVSPIELPGSDHSPFLNRPAALARLLVDLSG